MIVRVRLFASAREAAGSDSIDVAVPEPATAAAVLAALAALPRLGEVARRSRLAANHAFAPPGALVGPADELALIPPVGGG